jgi:hypothetical protein
MLRLSRSFSNTLSAQEINTGEGLSPPSFHTEDIGRIRSPSHEFGLIVWKWYADCEAPESQVVVRQTVVRR